MGTDMYSHVQTLNNSFTSLSSQYGDLNSYQQIDPCYNQTTGLWNPVYTASPDEWSVCSQSSSFPGSNHVTEINSLGYFESNCNPLPSSTDTLSTHLSPPVIQHSNDSQRRKPDWIRSSVSPSQAGGRTRTKDKYRVVYSDKQRMELEKEFQSNRYITIGRKSEMSLGLCLSERQVKIWFQNRRAKERKLDRKKLQQAQQALVTALTPLPELAATDSVSKAASLTQINMSRDSINDYDND